MPRTLLAPSKAFASASSSSVDTAGPSADFGPSVFAFCLPIGDVRIAGLSAAEPTGGWHGHDACVRGGRVEGMNAPGIRRQAALVRSLLDELERIVPLTDRAGQDASLALREQLAEELVRLGSRLLEPTPASS